MARRYTTRAEDAKFMAERLADLDRDWKVGDRCASYNMRTETVIAEIFDVPGGGKAARLANGDVMHITKVRSFKAR